MGPFTTRRASLVFMLAGSAGLLAGCASDLPEQRLISAVLDNDIVKVRQLLDDPKMGVSWRQGGRAGTALAAAAQRNYVDIMRLLLERGANPDAAGTTGGIPIVGAAYHGHRAAVAMLIKAGANLNNADKRYNDTALINAAWKGHTEIVRLLVAAGADIEVRSADNLRAVDWARHYGHKDIEAMLVEAENSRLSVATVATP
jgi:ankyrin repeat protein